MDGAGGPCTCQGNFSIEVDGQPVKTAVYRSYKALTWLAANRITNTGEAPYRR